MSSHVSKRPFRIHWRFSCSSLLLATFTMAMALMLLRQLLQTPSHHGAYAPRELLVILGQYILAWGAIGTSVGIILGRWRMTLWCALAGTVIGLATLPAVGLLILAYAPLPS